MIITKICDAIESHEMAAGVNIASSLGVALDIIRTHPTVRELAKELRSPLVAEHVLYRVLELTQRAVDLRYENPNDTALMIYVWLLSRRDTLLSSVACAAISNVPNLWWASKVATGIIQHRFTQNEASGAVSTPLKANAQAGDRLFMTGPKFPFPGRIRFIGRPNTLSSRGYSGACTTLIYSGQLPLFPRQPGWFTVRTENGSTTEVERLKT